MKVVISTLDSLVVSVDSLPKSDHETARDFQSKKKKTFLASRVLLRLALKAFYALDEVPALSFGPHGKPYFDPAFSIFFNFSHSGNYIGAAFSKVETGFDIECVKARKNFQGLCKKVLTSPERDFVCKFAEQQQREFFTLLWTVRESLLKDSGLGLVGLSKLQINPELRRGFSPDNPALCVHSYKITSLFPSAHEKAYFSLTDRSADKIEFYTVEHDGLKALTHVKAEGTIRIN